MPSIQYGCSLWCLIALQGWLSAPVPGLNEPHYLGKARHLWDPTWCAGDFFLESADAHVLFFFLLGWIGQRWGMWTLAIVGRLAGYAVLAWGWYLWTTALGLRSWSLALFSVGYLLLEQLGTWSGEWLVGGIEAKVFSYGCLFAAWGLWGLREHPEACQDDDSRQEFVTYHGQRAISLEFLLHALAIGFHPLVGGWGTLFRVAAGSWLAIHQAGHHPRGTITRLRAVTASAGRVLTQMNAGTWGMCALLLAVGFGPVLTLLLSPVSPQERYVATYIQVYYRLAHHLDPMQFPLRAHGWGLVMLVFWGITLRLYPRRLWTPADHQLFLLAVGSLLLALVGLGLGWGPRPPTHMWGYAWRMHGLKFYPFRLADILIPWCAMVFLIKGITARFPQSQVVPRLAVLSGMVVGLVILDMTAVSQPSYRRSHSLAWQRVCRWIREHVPRESLIITPHGLWSFKWFAERPEYVNFKDCPQDVRGIIEWNRRQLVLTRWYRECYRDAQYDRYELKTLREQTAADWLVVDETGPVELPPAYEDGTLKVYDLRILDEPSPSW
ncbi:MAG: hypothetical protein KatS3mg113_0626 [Planctomycetaceae bacterium]|nr:MAG: hypothetical protein KatS3mg113_0626 [Planctomycetaceae bacterium]